MAAINSWSEGLVGTGRPQSQPAASRRIPSLPALGLFAATAFAVLLLDALLHPHAAFDLRLMREVQAIDLPGLARATSGLEVLTDSSGAVAAWVVAAAVLAVRRWWVALLGVLILPLGGAINLAIGALVGRERPDLDVLARVSTNPEDRAFPSGHVQGAVMLYGFLFVVAGRIRSRLVRLAVRVSGATVVVAVGPARIWDGAHWPTDVLAGYALGGAMLAGLVAVYRRLETAAGDLPLVHAGPVPHDESRPHAHALTSTILFRGDTVAKIYNPGLLPRAIYWLAFQAPFAYERNSTALRAALLRRNLAGLLTEHWYGSNRVARAVGVERINGRLALIGEYVEGTEPRDHHAARRFLFELADRFDETGLPTWQIDPRQPRSLGNILERPDGTYAVIDLESGLVSPLASPRAWARALKRGLVPIYDDVYFDLTRAYVEREAAAMRAAHGDRWLDELRATLDAAAAAAASWHAGEPRIWRRLVLGIRSGFGVGTWPTRLRANAATGRERALDWIEATIATWTAEGRLTTAEATRLREQVESPGFQAVLPHFGVFLAIGVVLRFPFGSIARVGYVLSNQASATARLVTRRIDRAHWRRSMAIHSPLVLLFAALPGVGTFSYLASGPVLANRLLVRVAADAVLLRLPWRAYERTGLRRLIARPAQSLPTPTIGTRTEVAMTAPREVEGRWNGLRKRPLDSGTITERLARWMRVAAGIWLAAAIGVFLAAALRGGIPRSPQRGDWEILTQLGLLGLVAIGGALAWRWRGLGAAVVTLAAIGLGALASLEHHPLRALLVALVFYVPGLLFWLDWQRTKPPRAIVTLAAATAVALVVGGYQAHSIYETYFGPVQPESPLEAEPVTAVEWIWAGGTTDQGVTIKAKLAQDGGDVALLVSRRADLSAPVVTAPRPTSSQTVTFQVEGLTPDTEYWYAVAVGGQADLSRLSRFRTFPVGAASFSFAFGSCATTGSNGAVFDTIRGLDPLFFLIAGDFFYEDIAVDDPGEFHEAFDRNLTAPAPAALYRRVPVAYVWDDHDYDSNNADSTATSREAAYQVYDEVVPHYDLRDGAEPPIYQAFTVGRVRFIVTDARSARTPASAPDDTAKSMLGTEQKAWFERQLLAANGVYPVIVWVNSVPWIAEPSAGADNWGGYATERRELANFIADNEIRGLMMVSGDAHMAAIDDGTNSDYSTAGGGGFPVMHAAALDRHGSAKGGPYSEGAFPDGGQFGLVTVNDDGGSVIEVVLSGRDWRGEEVVAYRFTVAAPPATSSAVSGR